MSLRLSLLHRLNTAVWSNKAKRLVGYDRLPLGKKSRVAWATGVISYRSVYYMSDSMVYPYVCLKKYANYQWPLVQCCTEEEFIEFLKSETFHHVDITIPIEIKERVCDL